MDALRPFIIDNPVQVPPPLPYLVHADKPYAIDIELTVDIRPADGGETTVARSNFKYMYWTQLQQLAHHTSNGCPVRAGDLMGSGTISGQVQSCALARTIMRAYAGTGFVRQHA
jgi:fumarylacetoacetase